MTSGTRSSGTCGTPNPAVCSGSPASRMRETTVGTIAATLWTQRRERASSSRTHCCWPQTTPAGETESSPDRKLTVAELGRYLDYCSEMLSMTAKIAALYAERFSDNVVLQAVDEVETLTTGLSRKIWQKIMILDGPLGVEDAGH